VYVNGALLRTFSAGPGPVDIRDIPATDLSNQVTIVIEDALGRREIDSFTLGNDINLLSDGLNEFSFSLGVLRDNQVVGISYTSNPVASLFYRQGVSESLTLSGSAVFTEDYQNIGFSAAFAALRGVTQIDVAASSSPIGEGAVVSLAYRGTPIDLGFGGAQTNVRAEYRTPEFQTLASFGFLEDIKFDLAADVRANISPTLQAIVGATYFSTHRTDDQRYGLFGGLQKQLGRLNLGVNVRYSQFNAQDEFGVLVNASLPLGRRSNIFGTLDTASQTARVEFRQLRPLTLPEIEFGARARYGPDSYDIGGRFGYGTSRFEALVDVQQEYDRETSSFRNQSSVRLQTGIGFADGTFGIGRDPSRGFIVVKKHPTLEDAQVRVSTGSVGRDLGFANDLGPAVVPVFIPYRPQEIRVATENAPVGYNIGTGEYVAMPGARSGIVVSVGSDEYRVVIANLTGFDGERMGLVTGRLVDLETGKTRTFFTNRSGRVVFTQLATGRYRAEIDGSDFQFEFEVTEDAPANISLGDIEVRSSK
jgi:outer membrane usher protein FimD/PapC